MFIIKTRWQDDLGVRGLPEIILRKRVLEKVTSFLKIVRFVLPFDQLFTALMITRIPLISEIRCLWQLIHGFEVSTLHELAAHKCLELYGLAAIVLVDSLCILRQHILSIIIVRIRNTEYFNYSLF
jgi:hypothetical protein